MRYPALQVVFVSSLFKRAAKDWWVHLRDEYEYNPDKGSDYDNEDSDTSFNGGPQYRFPDWNKFVEMICQQFCDPAIELIHEKKMGEIRMTGPTYLFFRQLKKEAKLAKKRNNETEGGALVKAVRAGVPRSYMQIITNIGFGIPRTYPEWKQCVLQMYEEHAKNDVYSQTHGLEQHQDKKPQQKPHTATSSKPATGGATSSSAGKPTDKPWDAQEWYTPKGKDAEMQINAQRKKLMDEGRCFRYQKKGHLSKDCPEKTTGHQVRAIEAVPAVPPMDSQLKIEEIKE